jgi:glycosyltransferase involved in cell wall biosynthesis
MPDPKPILLLVRELNLGGTERQLTELARALDRSRYTPHAGCFHPEGFRGDELRRAGVPVLHLKVSSFRSFSAISGARCLGAYLKAHRIVLTHTFDVPLTQFGVPVARWFGCPVVLSSQRADRTLVASARRRWLRVTDRFADGIVVNAEAIERRLCEEEGVPRERIRLCYNGLDLERFSPENRRRMNAVAGASLVVGTLCALRPEKNLPLLMRAFARVRRLRPSIKLVVVGDGPLLPELRNLVRDLSIGDDCIFEPAVRDAAQWLRSIDIFVQPSLSEALSNSLMEAMACGCCPVATRVGGNPELVNPGATGLLVESDDELQLAEALAELIGSDPSRTRMAECASNFVRQNFSVGRMTARMMEIYDEFLDRAGRRGKR